MSGKASAFGLLVAIGASIGFLTGSVVGALATRPGREITAATVVMSPCGIYGITTTHADGGMRSYDGTSPAPRETLLEIDALPQDKVAFIAVPCPTFQVPEYEAQSQDQAQGTQATARGQAPGNGSNRPGFTG